MRAPGRCRIRNSETKHGTKLRPSNFGPKNGTETAAREKIGHEQGSSLIEVKGGVNFSELCLWWIFQYFQHANVVRHHPINPPIVRD